MQNESIQQSKKINRDLIDLLTRESTSGLPISLICAAVMVFAFDTVFVDKVYWFASFSVFVLVRLFTTLFWFRFSNNKDFDLLRYQLLTRVGIILIALHWAAFSFLFIPHITNLIELALSVTIITAISGGSTSTLSGDKKVCAIFVSFLMLPLASVLLVSEIESVYYLGILAAGFFVVILGSGIRSAQFTYQSANTKYEKDKLVLTLETRVKERTAEIQRLSSKDGLTKLYNRKAFSEQLTELMKLSEPLNKKLAVLFIDLDGFKSINDIHGHEVGDQILVKVAERLADFFDNKGVLCRWGGDEFIVALEYQGDDQTIELGNQLINYLSEPITSFVGVVSINASIGVALFPDHGVTESDLISHADIAMYQQKTEMKGKVLMFSESMRDELAYQLVIKNDLKDAIVNNELYLEYQPIVDVKHHKIFIAEALIRWNKDGQQIPPLTFIHIAEQYGLIQEIGLWVARQVANDLSSQPELTLNVSINISVAELMLVDFADCFNQIFRNKNIDTQRICIEVTESVLTRDTDFLLKNLARLRGFGFLIAVDDFGTGYSSLSQLQKLGPSIIKIDKSFVDTWDSGGKSIIKAVNDISEELRFVTVVEGVEQLEQVNNVSNLGAIHIQGYHFAKPMSFERLIDWKPHKD